jgi:hypothetical protein
LGREICNRTGRLLTESFNIGDKSIECVKQYKYLGLVIQNNGNVNEAKKKPAVPQRLKGLLQII